MRSTLKTAVILAGLAIAAPACGSDPADDLVGEWTGQCTTVPGQDGSRKNLDTTLEFGPDGQYFQQVAGPTGGEVEGTYTATEDTINLQGPGGTSIDATYSISDGTLTLKATDPSTDGEGSTCTLSRS